MDTPNKSSGDVKNVNPFLKAIFILIAIPAMAVWESAKFLCRKTYEETNNGLTYVFGVLSTLAGGIGAGYELGWVLDKSWAYWVSGGVLAAVLSFAYVWPLIYLGGIRKAIDLSDYLWRKVDGSRRSDSWVTGALMFISKTATVVGGASVGLYCISHAHTFLGAHGFDGWFLNGLAWVISLVFGALIGLGVGAAAWGLVSLARIPLVAALTGAGLTYLLNATTQSLIASHGWNAYWGYGASLAEFLVYVGYLFPAVHIVLTSLDDVFEYLWDIYDQPKNEYRDFFLQVSNIATAWRLTALSFLVSAYFGLSGHWSLAVAVLVAGLSYTLIGKLLNLAGTFLVGAVVSLHVALVSGLSYYHHGWWLGIGGAIGGGIVAGLLTLGVLFPIAYVVVRFLTSFLLASWAGPLLAALHKNVCKLFNTLVDEVFSAGENTYGDRTAYRSLFLQLLNLGGCYASFVGIMAACNALGFSLGLTIPTLILGVFLCYLLVGKLLLKAGNPLVGILSGLAGGVWAGAWTLAAQSHGYWVAVPVGLVAAAATYGLVFPVSYVVVRAIINVVRPEKWAEPFLSGCHAAVWKRVAQTWAEFVQVYRGVKEWFKPTWANVMASWHSASQTVKDTWESVFGKKH